MIEFVNKPWVRQIFQLLIGSLIGFIIGFMVVTDLVHSNGFAPWAVLVYVPTVILSIIRKWWLLLVGMHVSVVLGGVAAEFIVIGLVMLALCMGGGC